MGIRYRREIAHQCAHIQALLEDNQYTKALEEIDNLSLEDVDSIQDLYLFADIYEKAERLDKKKEILYMIYNRSHAKHVLYSLLRLVIRLGDMDEARNLFVQYEMSGGATLDTYEIRYLMSKAEGQSRSSLITILEELKNEEYTEEWGYQLARLYEQEGLREKCIQECKDLELWFGEGKIVDKARALRVRCEADDWTPPVDEEIPEVEEPDGAENMAFAVPPVAVQELEEDAEEDDHPDEIEPNLMSEEESAAVSELARGVAEAVSEEARETSVSDTMVSEPRPTAETVKPASAESGKEPERAPAVEEEQEEEDVSGNGIRYRSLKSTIRRMKHNSEAVHFAFAGGEEKAVLTVAKRITKELNRVGYFSAQSIVKITAEKLNNLKLSDQMEKLVGACMLVTDAPELSGDSVEELVSVIEGNGDRIVVMLAGPFDEMDCFLSIYPKLNSRMSYKVKM